MIQRQNHQIAAFIVNQDFAGIAQHFFHGFDIQTFAGNLRCGFIFRQNFCEASHFTLCFQDGLSLIRTRFFQNTLSLTVCTRLNFVGVRFCFTDVLLFVFTCCDSIVKRGFYFFRRTCCLEVDVQQGDTHVVRTDRFFQFTLGIATNNGTPFGQDTVHGVFTDNPTQGAVSCLTQTVIRTGYAKQVTLRIGHAVLYVHFDAHDVFVRGQHNAGCGKFTHGFNVDRCHFIDKGRFPVQTRFNQMAEFTEACHHATFRFFNGIETASRPDNDDGGRCDSKDSTAQLRTRALR